MAIIIIAEAGVNHNGNLELAYQMVEAAARSGADIVKFQTFQPECVVSKFAEKASYQKATTGATETQLDMVRKLFLPLETFDKLRIRCEECGIGFMSTPFDLGSIDALKTLKMPFWKIPSGEITNLPYLIKIASLREKVILSTGMCRMEEIEKALEILKSYGTSDITLLHCTTEYPAPYEEVNLLAMESMRKTFDLPIGYSDHTEGTEIPVAAAALGAVVIEKHFTLSKEMEGPDHKASLTPEELRQMVQSVRKIERAMGNGLKEPSKSELKNIPVARKSIVAACPIKKGELLTAENLTVKRPGDGISPMRWQEVIGQVSEKEYEEDEQIRIN